MGIKPVTLVMLAIVAMTVIPACGLTGSTRPYVMEFADGEINNLTRRVVYRSFAVEADAAAHYIPGGFVSRTDIFSESDRAVFRDSVTGSLNNVPWPDEYQPEDEWQLDIILRRYVVATGSFRMAVLAIVSWAISDHEGNVVFQEQFYASVTNTDLLYTVGMIRDLANRAAIKRIIDSSLIVAAGGDPNTGRTFASTYKTLSEALQGIPNGYAIIDPTSSRSASGTLDWYQYEREMPVNWRERLASHYRGDT